MSTEWLALLMFAGLVVFLLSGFPVAFSFVGTAVVFGLIGYGLGVLDPNRLRILPNVWFGTMSNLSLLAIPFFIFLGSILEKSGLAQDLLETVGILLGPLRGGLALTVVIVGTLLAATTGVVAATIIVMGMLTLPAMLRYGYDKQLASGVIVASGTLAQMIPPSIVLVLLGDQVGVPVGDLFLGALIPGLMLSGAYGAYVLAVAYLKPNSAPPLPPEARTLTGWALARLTFLAVVPPGFLVFAVLGSIFFGIAAPFESGCVGAVGAIVLAALRGKASWKLIYDSAHTTARVTALVVIILFCATTFSQVFDVLGGKQLITDILVAVPGGKWGFLIVANIVVFLLGIPLEFTEIVFIVMPLFVPAARALGFTDAEMLWFSIVLAINLQTAFISPPVGFSLFYLQSAAPKSVTTADIHRSAIPFVVLQVIILLVVVFVPATTTWLPALADQLRGLPGG